MFDPVVIQFGPNQRVMIDPMGKNGFNKEVAIVALRFRPVAGPLFLDAAQARALGEHLIHCADLVKAREDQLAGVGRWEDDGGKVAAAGRHQGDEGRGQ